MDMVSEIHLCLSRRFLEILLSKFADPMALLLQTLQPFALRQLLILAFTFWKMIVIILVLLCCLFLIPLPSWCWVMLVNHLYQLIFIILLQFFHDW